VEGDALDQPGDFLGRGSVLWVRGVHRGFIFAWAASALGDPIARDSGGIWLPGWGLGRLGRFIGAGSLCDHLGGWSRDSIQTVVGRN
jgi:hypothetical protein